LRLWLFFEILPVDSIEIMGPFLCDSFDRFIAFIDINLFFLEIFTIGCTWIKFIPFRIDDIRLLWLVMRISMLFSEVRSIGSTRIEWLSVRIKLIVFYKDGRFIYFLRPKLLSILRGRIERDIFILILHPWNYFLSHLRFLSGVVLPV
jgi:hypothetical protein